MNGMSDRKMIYLDDAIDAFRKALCCGEREYAIGFGGIERILNALPSEQPEPEWHDCDLTDKSTLPEPGSWAIWSDKEDHKIIARWKEDAIDHFWPDQRMFDFDLEDAVAWTEIPKRTKNTNDIMRLPFVEPVRMKGRWIVTNEFEDCRYAKCNQCKVTQVFYYNKPLTNYCPNCGFDMREGEEE